MIYLDYNATSPVRAEVKAAMIDLLGESLNPSSIHIAGRKARKIVEEARADVLTSVNATNLVFCGSGTEANNLALAQADNVLVSEIEHDSVYKYPGVKTFKVLPNGIIDLEDLKQKVTGAKLVSVMRANNETGIIQPIKEAAKIAHEAGALVHCDAVQAFGKIEIDFADLDVDLMTISSHKVGGPVGVAALIHKKHIELKPISFGGGQEKNKRPGTENVPVIAGFGMIAKMICEAAGEQAISPQSGVPSEGQEPRRGTEKEIVSRETIKNNAAKALELKKYLEASLKQISPGTIIFGEEVERLPNTSCLTMPGAESAVQLIHFDMAKICVSSGSACSSGKVEVSRVLKAMNGKDANCALRISTGWATTKDDIDGFLKSWTELYKRIKGNANS